MNRHIGVQSGRRLTTAGSYLLICNVPGHYAAGMVAVLTDAVAVYGAHLRPYKNAVNAEERPHRYTSTGIFECVSTLTVSLPRRDHRRRQGCAKPRLRAR
jgi:hypothetical protein